ncbi:MAG: hypothetical protein HPY53_03935 [Brevinematales bacterium]|nr:hypothetical protein [Brevinematales bacterium]
MENDIPDSLYHYTDIESLKSIIEKKELWATNCLFMNDSKEMMYFLDSFYKYFNKKSGIIRDPKEVLINWIKRDQFLEKFFKDSLQHYVLSFSKDGDSLILWGNYSKNIGYCIEFSRTKLVLAPINQAIFKPNFS